MCKCALQLVEQQHCWIWASSLDGLHQCSSMAPLHRSARKHGDTW